MIKLDFLSNDELNDLSAGITARPVKVTCAAITGFSGSNNTKFSSCQARLKKIHEARLKKIHAKLAVKCGGLQMS